MASALGLLGLAVLAALWRPGGGSPALYAAGAALVALILGLAHLSDVAAVFRLTWDATVTLVALLIISALLDQAGLFRWAAWRASGLSRGRPRRLFVAAVLLSVVSSVLFTNDGTVLLLTPLLAEICISWGLPSAAALPILLANGFMADVASTPLLSSNLVNILAADRDHLSFAVYAGRMWAPSLAAVATALILCWLVEGRRIPPHVAAAGPGLAATTLDRPLALAGLTVLAGAAAAFVLTATTNLPAAAILGPAAAALWAFAVARRGLSRAWRAARGAPWDVIVFAVAMNVVIVAVLGSGVGRLTAGLVDHLPAGGAGIFTVGAVSAALASALNNIPSTLLGLLALAPVAAGVHGRALIAAAVAGNDIGPKLTPIGSLATLIWVRAARRRGVAIPTARYVVLGLICTPLVLAAFLGTLARVG